MKKRLSITFFSRYLLLIAIVLFGSTPLPVSAVNDSFNSFMQDNNILYFNPGGQACSTVGVAYSTSLDLPTLSGNDNAEKIWNFLTGEAGLSPEQTAGIMGNISQESNFDPAAVESNGIGFGIVQWTYERRNGFGKDEQNNGKDPIGGIEKAAEDEGVPASDLGFQLAYMVQESKGRTVYQSTIDQAEGADFGQVGDNEWETLKKQKTAEDAAVFWHANFEISADDRSQIQERINDANSILEQFGDNVGTAAKNATGGAACSAAGSGDLIATLLEYAWPTHTPYGQNGKVDPPPKPAYLDVATKLTNEGKWVGGGMAEIGVPAIDCGGFVSILLTQSGFEPDYNYGLDMSRGASNQNGEGGDNPSGGQMGWAQRNWKFLGYGGEINVSDLRPGDVAYSNTHTFIYVGQVDGFESQYASASYDWWRAPMAGGTYETATHPDYVWYGRREGTPPAYGSTKASDPIPAGNNIFPGTATRGQDW